MIEALDRYKVSNSEMSEEDHCPLGLLFYKTEDTEASELSRGADFAQLEAEWYKTADPAEMLEYPYKPHLRLREQPIFNYFSDLLEWDVEDNALTQIYEQFCLFQTERFATVEKTFEALVDYFFPVLSEFEIEGTSLTGRPDAVFREPGTINDYYIQDSKTSLNPPTWRVWEGTKKLLKKTKAYYRVHHQLHTYHIIFGEHSWNTLYGKVAHFWPYGYDTENITFRKATVKHILNVRVLRVRALYRIFRDNITDMTDRSQIKRVGRMVIKSPNAWKCNRCSRNLSCPARTIS